MSPNAEPCGGPHTASMRPRKRQRPAQADYVSWIPYLLTGYFTRCKSLSGNSYAPLQGKTIQERKPIRDQSKTSQPQRIDGKQKNSLRHRVLLPSDGENRG